MYLIKSGQLRPGEILPTVRELAVILGVNYNTVHKVYRDLEADRLISSGRGRRSSVALDIAEQQLERPASPVDIVIDELVKTAEECGMVDDELMTRLQEKLAERASGRGNHGE